MRKLEDVLKRLSDKIAFLTMLSQIGFADLLVRACGVRDKAEAVFRILPDHSQPMDRNTVGLAIDRSEKTLKYLNHLERRFLVSQSWSEHMREKLHELHPSVLRNGHVAAKFHAWDRMRSQPAKVEDLRAAYLEFHKVFEESSMESARIRAEEVLKAQKPSLVERRRHPRSEQDRVLRAQMKGKSIPVDKSQGRKRKTA